MQILIIQTVTWPHVGHLIKGTRLKASNTKSAPCLLWCWYIFYRWRYVLYLSSDPTRPLCWDVMCIYGWELLAACHHPEKFVIRTIGILIVNSIQDGFFGAAHGWGAKKALHSLKSVTHILQWWNLAQLYLI